MNLRMSCQARATAQRVPAGRECEGAMPDGTIRSIHARRRNAADDGCGANVAVPSAVLAPLASTSPSVPTTDATPPALLPRHDPAPIATVAPRVPPPRPWPDGKRAGANPRASAVGAGCGISSGRSGGEPRRPAHAAGVAELVAAAGSPVGVARTHGRAPRRRATRAERRPLPDQPGHRLAALRRSAADRRGCPGQCLGSRSAAHTGQGALGSTVEYRR